MITRGYSWITAFDIARVLQIRSSAGLFQTDIYGLQHAFDIIVIAAID